MFQHCIRQILLATVGLFLVGLAAACQTTPAQLELMSCDTAASAIEEAATLNDAKKLSVSQADKIDHAVVVINDACQGPPPDINAKSLNIAMDAAGRLVISIISQIAPNWKPAGSA